MPEFPHMEISPVLDFVISGVQSVEIKETV
jgi:hypothetical protein